MKKSNLIFLKHIKNSIELIEKYILDKNKTDFINSSILQDSIIRRLEIIGETTKNMGDNFKKKYPEIEWKKISGMRDILIHQYFGVDLDLTWEVINKDLSLNKLEKFLF